MGGKKEKIGEEKGGEKVGKEKSSILYRGRSTKKRNPSGKLKIPLTETSAAQRRVVTKKGEKKERSSSAAQPTQRLRDFSRSKLEIQNIKKTQNAQSYLEKKDVSRSTKKTHAGDFLGRMGRGAEGGVPCSNYRAPG